MSQNLSTITYISDDTAIISKQDGKMKAKVYNVPEFTRVVG